MKKAVSSFVAVAGLLAAPGVLPHFASGLAQAASGGGQITMDAAENAAYDNAVNKQTTPQTQAPAIEAYLQAYPKSAVKAYMLALLLNDYSQFDPAKAITAADNVLAVDPNSIQALTVETVFRSQAASALPPTDTAGRQAAMDAAASFAQKGLAATKPADVPQATWDANTAKVNPTFYSTIGNDDLAKKDYAGAIAAFKSELAALPIASTTQAGTALQDTYYLGQAYYLSTPPDYVNCTFYTTRAASYAPATLQAQLQPLATYCYKKYHGKSEGYDAVVAAAKANLNPPAGFSIVPAPSDADVAHQYVTGDLTALAISDKEFILANGTPADANKVFDSVKGKEDRIPNATVIAATADSVQVAYSEDAVQSKTADFTFNLKTPLKTLPPVGTKITLLGTWSSFTQKPLMIVMSDAEEPSAAKKPPVRRH